MSAGGCTSGRVRATDLRNEAGGEGRNLVVRAVALCPCQSHVLWTGIWVMLMLFK